MTSSRESRFRELSDQVAGPLRAYVVRRVAPADVDDVLSEVSLVLWRRLEEVPEDTPLPWCYAVARRLVANQHRGNKRRLRLADRVRTIDPPREMAGPDGGPGPHHDDVHDDVREALTKLKDLDREVVTLWAWEQLEPREIAEATGMTANAVSIRLHRAKKQLAAELERTSGSGKNDADAGHIPYKRGSER